MEGLHSKVYQLVILFQVCKETTDKLSLADRVNEIHRNLRKRMGLVGSKLARFLQLFFNVHLQFPKPTT